MQTSHSTVVMQSRYEYNFESSRIELVTPTNRYQFLRNASKTVTTFPPALQNKGSFLVENIANRQCYIQKRQNTDSEEEKERSAAERQALVQMKNAGGCRNIIALLEIHEYIGINQPALITEYCDAGTLAEMIAATTPQAPTSEEFAWHVMSELTSALCFCHSGIRQPSNPKAPMPVWEPIYHMNITPANILLAHSGVVGQRYPRVVLSNFECVTRESDIRTRRSQRIFQLYATPAWCPPEVVQAVMFEDGAPTVGHATDIWQMGGVIQVLCRLNGSPETQAALEMMPCGARYSSMLNHTTAHCMVESFRDRPTAIQLYLPIQQYIDCMVRSMQGMLINA